MKALIYDIEIKKAIQSKNEERLTGIDYCEGWHDHANMGIACIGVYDYAEDRYRMFMDDNMDDFFHLCDDRELLVGFNNIAFDNAVINASAPMLTEASKFFDILVELWAAAGLGPQFKFPTHAGFGLDTLCKVNFGTAKSGHGALAPVDFQKGRYGSLVDYCLNDVRLTKQALDEIMRSGQLRDPRDPSKLLILSKPNIVPAPAPAQPA